VAISTGVADRGTDDDQFGVDSVADELGERANDEIESVAGHESAHRDQAHWPMLRLEISVWAESSEIHSAGDDRNCTSGYAEGLELERLVRARRDDTVRVAADPGLEPLTFRRARVAGAFVAPRDETESVEGLGDRDVPWHVGAAGRVEGRDSRHPELTVHDVGLGAQPVLGEPVGEVSHVRQRVVL